MPFFAVFETKFNFWSEPTSAATKRQQTKKLSSPPPTSSRKKKTGPRPCQQIFSEQFEVFFTQLCYLYSFILGHFLFTTHFLLGLPASHFCADQLLDRSLAAKWARLLITTDDYATRILLWLCCKISYWAVLVLGCSERLQHGWVVAGSILAALRFFTEAWRPVDWFRGGWFRFQT